MEISGAVSLVMSILDNGRNFHECRPLRAGRAVENTRRIHVGNIRIVSCTRCSKSKYEVIRIRPKSLRNP